MVRIRGRRRRALVAPKAATHFPSLRESYDLDQTTHMFLEDVRSMVLPWDFDRDSEKYKAELVGDESEVEKALSVVSSLAQHDHYHLAETVSGAVGSIVSDISWTGRAVYEIVPHEDGPNVSLRGFTSKRLYKLIRYYLQVIPVGDRQLWERSYTLIPSKDIWTISMPQSLGGYRGYRAVLRKLRKFPGTAPNFYMQAMEAEDPTQAFEFSLYQRHIQINIQRIAKSWGWIRREQDDKYLMEFARLYKRLTFKRAQAILRDHVINEINRLFKRLGIAANLQVEGLQTPKELLDVRQKVWEGVISFEEAYDAILS